MKQFMMPMLTEIIQSDCHEVYLFVLIVLPELIDFDK